MSVIEWCGLILIAILMIGFELAFLWTRSQLNAARQQIKDIRRLGVENVWFDDHRQSEP